MPEFEQIATEYAYGIFAGADFGSKIRVLMRGEKWVMFVGYGINISTRESNSYTNNVKLCSKAHRADLSRPEVRAKIVALFGEGADEAAIKAISSRGLGTVLVDGGGTKLPLPALEARLIKTARYESITPSMVYAPHDAKTCLQCGEQLRLRIARHHLRNDPLIDPNHPKTLEDCQRLTNYPIVRIVGYPNNTLEERWPFISYFETWDGESYDADTFCDDRCAATYGRRAAAELSRLEVGGAPPVVSRGEHESHHHYDRDEEQRRSTAAIEKSFAELRERQKKLHGK